mgnify:CR=1 FL=1
MAEQVFLKFGANGEYFEIEVEKMSPITTELINKMPVERKKWGEVVVKNKPYKYRQNPISANKLYTEILSLSPTDYVFIKHIGSDSEVTEGYFGIVDCEIDATEKKLIKVTPEIFDQYTPLLEYWDTKVDVFGLKNIILNSKFNSFVDGLPKYWTHITGDNYLSPNGVSMLDTTTIHLKTRGSWAMYNYYEGVEDMTLLQAYSIWPESEFYDRQQITQIYQDERPIKAGSSLYVKFFWQLLERWNPNMDRSLIQIKISVLRDDGVTVYMNDSGEWTYSPTALKSITINPSKLPLPIGSIDGFVYYSKILPDVGKNGTLRIDFYSVTVPTDSIRMDETFPTYTDGGWTYYESDLIITDIDISASPYEYKDINVRLISNELVIKRTDQIKDENGLNLAKDFTGWLPYPEVSEYEDGGKLIMDYYIDLEDNSPNIDNMSSSVMGFFGGGEAKDELSIQGYIDLFADVNSNFYKGEICEIDMYQLDRWSRKGALLKRYQVFRVEIKFAREEQYSKETYTTEDDEIGLIPDGSSIGDPKPPSGGGWVQEGNEDVLLGWLWVRFPFNQTINDWGRVDYGEGYRNGEKYTNRTVLTKQYPSSENTKSFETSVNFKDVVKAVFRGTNSELADKEVYSTFLWNDYPSGQLTTNLLSRLPILADDPTTNYHTKTKNYLNKISCLHTYDLKTEKSIDDKDSVLLLSFRDLIDDIMVAFPNTFYFLDIDGNLHIEHLSYEDYTADVMPIINEAYGYQRWKYIKSDMFALIDLSMINTSYSDFTNTILEFDKIVSNRRRTDIRETKQTKYITTDIQHCMENPDELSNGLILINYDDSSGENILKNGVGASSNSVVPNADISLANMYENFGNFEGTWQKGTINDQDAKFKHTKWTMEGVDAIELKGIYRNKYFYTALGIGLARSKTYDSRKGITIVDLIYRYNESVIITSTNDILEL